MGQPGARIAAGRVHIVLPNRPEATQQNGYFHVGATSAIANSAGGHAAFTLFTENTPVLTVEYKINLLAPAVGDHIKAVGTEVRTNTAADICVNAHPEQRMFPPFLQPGRQVADGSRHQAVAAPGGLATRGGNGNFVRRRQRPRYFRR
ncbi:PaaI family thioesterase [Streptomyces atratus]|uniref:PaaI family thioesterase n=1 Tax=Streptomyces atratus TaxID=1893 RepID=UPI001E441E0E|nr:PaaI family thioesterase [Streptomyces atratus]WPW33289.1 PaaI family thioesterase [Streptomyces atratus]